MHQQQTVTSIPLPAVNPDEQWFQPDPAVCLEAEQVARELEFDEALIARLVMLGMSAQDVSDYLLPSPQHIADPEATVPGIRAAARALARAISAGEPVAIYADYDVDGQTSLAILAGTLERYGAKLHLGSANAVSGFGLTRSFVEEAAAGGARWLVTVDCGSTQTEPVKLAQSLGMRVVIIDHHDVDIANPAEHHLNPRVFAAQALHSICEAQLECNCRQKLMFKAPYDEQAAKLTVKSIERLTEELGADWLDERLATIERFAHPHNTGALLTWKFCAAFYLAHHDGVPAYHWGSPLYLAGLGAIADLAPCNDIEVRAAVRVPTNHPLQEVHFGNADVVPLGVRMLSEALDENPDRPDTLIRTKALLNLPKRTSEIDPADVQRILRSDDRELLAELIPRMVSDYERLSAIRREEMDPDALEQVNEASARGERTYFAYAVLNGFEHYAGYARMVANTLARETGKPAVVFARKSLPAGDEFGQTLYKFSGANDVVPDAQLGDLIHDEALQQSCLVRMRDWLGEPAEIVNLGGHTAVISGVVTAENIEVAQAAFEAWAQAKDKKGNWRPIDRKRPRVWARRVSPARLRRLEREAALLYPLNFPEAPALQVSVLAAITPPRMDAQLGSWKALLRLEDGSERGVTLPDDMAALVRAHPGQRFECLISLGNRGDYYVGRVAVP